jgi:putative ABC transport system permease protein
MDDCVIVPLTTAMRRMFNVTTRTMVRVRVDGLCDVQRVTQEIRAPMHEHHHIQPPDLDNFRVVTADAVAALSQAPREH